MYNPYEDFNAKDEPLSEDLRNQLLQEKAQSEQTVMTMQAAEQAAASPTAATGTPQAAQAGASAPASATQAKEESTSLIPKDIGQAARNVAEGGFAPIAGVADWAVDLYNILPTPDIPKIPKFKNDLFQAAREISSVVLPTILLTRGLGAAGAATQAKVKWELGKNALVKWLGEAGVAAGAGAFVDATNKLNETDDNLQGSLKKMFPKTFSWISDDWATLDNDAPDVKRAKNVNEGVGLGIFTDLLVGGAKLLKATVGTKQATGFIPKDEQAVNFKRQHDTDTQSAADEMFESAGRREEVLNERADYGIATNKEGAYLGIHDVFDVEEAGVRSVDSLGVVGAAVDQVRISKNYGTVYGRLGNFFSEPAMKYVLRNADPDTFDEVDQSLVDSMTSAGKWEYLLGDGRTITAEEAAAEMRKLGASLLDPRMDTEAMQKVFQEFNSVVDGVERLGVDTKGNIAYGGALVALRGLRDAHTDLNKTGVQGLLATSLAGQVSDLSEGARLMDGTAAIERAQEQVLDKIEYLTVVQGRAKQLRSEGLGSLKEIYKHLNENDFSKVQQMVDSFNETKKATDQEIIDRAKRTVDTLRQVSKERPEYLKPLQMAWEFTDGNVDTMSKLNRYVDQSLGDWFPKFFVDGSPEIPNVIVQGMWSNIYNSVLTSVSTPLKAGFANAAMLLEKPITVLGGAVIGGDVKTLKRGWYQYSAFADTFNKGLKHMTDVYRKAAADPTSVGYIMRDDLVKKNEETMDILQSYAMAAQQTGNDGPMALYHKAEALNDMANNPWLRFGANAMTALDGFARAMIANAEVRGQIYDKFIDGGRKLDADGMKKALDDHYNKMFDSTGMITNEAVDYASREIAMNLDHPAVDGLSRLINQYPAMKPFLMFPRTSVNILDMANKHSPISIFAKEYNQIAYKPLSNFTGDEIKEILETRGIKVASDEEMMDQFATLRAEVRGRKAIGTITMMTAGAMFLNGGLRGNGHYDKERNRVRQELGWKPRTYKGWDGKWYSYDGLGPISDFLALTADVMDNFDSITENDLETTINKLGFILVGNVTNKSMLAGLEPMNDVLAGNPAALNRWAASFASSLAPLSGARNELGRLLAPSLRELDMEFTQLLRNRNKFLDTVDPKGALPDKHDWIDGTKVGYPENFFVRAWNAVSPMKVYDGQSAERQFLLDIEYDSRPSFNKSTKGVEYTPKERSELFSLMGQQGYFKKELQRIMQGTDAQAWRESIKTERGGGSRIDPNQWMNLYRQIDVALDRSKRMAEVQLSNRDEVMRRQYEQGLDKAYQQRGVSILQWQNK
jgi:hypothetical protein